ncbi:MAG: hypothetical protein V3571_02800 [Pseudodesulfovibrio sp.]
MPTDTAMDILAAFRLKRKLNPAADRATLFKYVLWDRFSGRMVADAELADMAASARTLADLAFAVLAREKPALAQGRLAESARDAIRRFYAMNYPDAL